MPLLTTGNGNFGESRIGTTRWTAVLFTCTLLLTGCAGSSPGGEVAQPRVKTAAPPTAGATGSALAQLATLPVKGRAPKTGYSRTQFGPAWADVDRNGCDTRNDILARDLTAETFRAGTHNCVVLSGQLRDPYTGRTVSFSKSQASAVQIDHVVSLSNAWQTGGQALSPGRREAFANDRLNLLAVDGPTNQAKSDSDAATWLPPDRSYRCAMVARQIAVKAAYLLWVTAAEREAMARVLSSCPQQASPGRS